MPSIHRNLELLNLLCALENLLLLQILRQSSCDVAESKQAIFKPQNCSVKKVFLHQSLINLHPFGVLALNWDISSFNHIIVVLTQVYRFSRRWPKSASFQLDQPINLRDIIFCTGQICKHEPQNGSFHANSETDNNITATLSNRLSSW